MSAKDEPDCMEQFGQLGCDSDLCNGIGCIKELPRSQVRLAILGLWFWDTRHRVWFRLSGGARRERRAIAQFVAEYGEEPF